MVRSGQVRITTLHECRSWDHPELGDPEEGKGILRQTIQNREFTQVNPMPGPLGTMIHAKNIKVGRIAGSWPIDPPDVYMYCATRNASRRVMEEFGYDTCVRIDNPICFIEAISEQLARRNLVPLVPFIEEGVAQPRVVKISRVEINDCFYESRDREWLEGQPPQWLIKNPRHSHQEEIRSVWEPLERPIQSEIVESLCTAISCNYYELPDFTRTYSTSRRSASPRHGETHWGEGSREYLLTHDAADPESSERRMQRASQKAQDKNHQTQRQVARLALGSGGDVGRRVVPLRHGHRL